MIDAAALRQPGNPAKTQKIAATANDTQTSFCFMKVTPDLWGFASTENNIIFLKKEKASLQRDTEIYVHAGAEVSERLPGMGIML